AEGEGFLDAVREVEKQPDATFDSAWSSLGEMGLATIALPESVGGGGGTVLDASVALEACARSLVPGHLLSTTIVGSLVADVADVAGRLAEGARAAFAPTASLQAGDRLTGTVDVVWDAPGADLFLLGSTDGRWFVVDAEHVTVTPAVSLDLTRRFGTVVVDTDAFVEVGVSSRTVTNAAITFAAAEAAGIARWALATSVEYAKVREQFGKPIGSFQAIKHLCAQMLEDCEQITAVAWDAAGVAFGDETQWTFSAGVAGTVAFDAAVRVTQNAIQVLGGIGFTFEHEAHFYLRRAVSLRNLVGRGHAEELAALAATGVRRKVDVDLEGRDEAVRPQVRETVARIAGSADQRAELVETGYLTPHWPAPYGLGADAVSQLVIDEELAAAGVERPDIKIAGWAVPTILKHGNDAQREQFVRPSLAGDIIWCQLFSEPGSGSDLASLRTRAVREESGPDGRSGWRLTGQKVWTSMARESQWGICLARTNPDAPQHKGITYFLVDMTSAGLDIRPLREMTGEELFNEVFLDNVFVPDEMVVGEVDNGWRLAVTTLANERVAMAGHRLGASTEEAVELFAEGGVAAGPGTAGRVGEAVALAVVCSLLGTRTVLRSLSGQGPGVESSVAKLLGVKSRQDASELVVDLLGEQMVLGRPEHARSLHESLLTRCLSIAGGTTQILRNVAGERILGLPR
ncbi:MAG: acyl-CoA dehydrogenase family protein, partial [Nocardioides sp.]|uniref:acyl-CoA dehydrogenase family protein n=1 Tax=Nocardioides sp. TaxID=35761 RepID=UPI003F0345A4